MMVGMAVDAGGPGSLAHRTDGTFWAVDASNHLLGFTPAGVAIGSWHGEVTGLHLPGELAGAMRVVGLPDGGLAVLCAPESLVEIFR